MLQAAFALRREESIKIIVAWADRGDWLILGDAWSKLDGKVVQGRIPYVQEFNHGASCLATIRLVALDPTMKTSSH
jgi:hypothetical protein